MHFLYPANPLRARQPDDQYVAEVEAIRVAGFEFSVFSIENFQTGDFRAVPSLPLDAEVLYRGWMLSAAEYESLISNLHTTGTRPFTSLENYLANHYLPNWYSRIADLTPETRVFPADCDLEAELRALAWPEFFIKDYVKSLKTSVGSRISKPEHVSTLVAEMKKFRGTIEGGFCVRRIEPFLPDTERRYFVVNGKPHSASGAVPSIVHECAKRLPSSFYSVDVIQRADGQLRIVEIGDGQVSDLVGWTPQSFAAMLAGHFSSSH